MTTTTNTLRIYYREKVGLNPKKPFAKMDQENYAIIERLLKEIVSEFEHKEVLEYMLTPHSKLKVGKSVKSPIEFIAGLTTKTLCPVHERDLTVQQLSYLNYILIDMGVDIIEFVNGSKPDPYNAAFGNGLFK